MLIRLTSIKVSIAGAMCTSRINQNYEMKEARRARIDNDIPLDLIKPEVFRFPLCTGASAYRNLSFLLFLFFFAANEIGFYIKMIALFSNI